MLWKGSRPSASFVLSFVLPLGSIKVKAYDMKAMVSPFYYRLQTKDRSQRDYSAATRLEPMEYLEECLSGCSEC